MSNGKFLRKCILKKICSINLYFNRRGCTDVGHHHEADRQGSDVHRVASGQGHYQACLWQRFQKIYIKGVKYSLFFRRIKGKLKVFNIKMLLKRTYRGTPDPRFSFEILPKEES